MLERKKTVFAGLLAVGLLALFATIFLTSRNRVAGERGSSQPNTAILVPAAIGTYSAPTLTPDLRPTPTYAPLPTLEPPPAAQTFPPDKSAPAPNVAWSARSDNSLALWVGQYNDSPFPMMTGAREVARWNIPQQGDYVETTWGSIDIAVSLNGKYLVTLLRVVCVPPPPEPTATPGGDLMIPGIPNVDTNCEGFDLEYIYVVDLATNRVQTIPDYNRYHDSNLQGVQKIIGWFDNDRFGIASESGLMLVANRDGSAIEARAWPGASSYDTVYSLSLLPDHKTIFAWVGDGFYFRDAPTGEVHRVGNRAEDVGYDYLTPSPNGKLISYLEAGLWVQELATSARIRLIETGVWDTHPAWSADSSQIAFAHVNTIPKQDNYGIDQPEKADTNIYLADISTHTSRQLTNFSGAHNTNITWTPGGNLLLSSSAGNRSGGFDLVAVAPIDGKVTTLVTAAPSEQLLHPMFFGEGTLPGMPRSGVKSEQPAPTPSRR